MSESGAPLLNDYKLDFFIKRFPQTLLGGVKLRLGYDAPFYVYFNQVFVFLLPLLLGGILTIISEYEVLSSLICCYVYGCLVTCLVLIVNLAVWFTNRRYTNVSKVQPNLLAEEDEVEFESCCGLETFQFIFSTKKNVAEIVVQGIVSGLLGAIMFLYLLPVNLNGLYGNTAVTVILYGFGWLVVCIAQYSLITTPPPEPAVFRRHLWMDITPFMRPFYVLLFGVSGLITGSYSTLLLNQVLHAVFPFLLFFWTFGTLPPLDALFSWLTEQILVFILGGSPMATDLRLLVMLLLSIIPAILAIFIPNHVVIIVLSSIFGYILSLDIFSIAAWTRPKITNNNSPKRLSVQQWSIKEVIITLTLLVLAAVCTSVGVILSDKVTSLDGFGLTFCVLLFILKCMGDLQGVYIMGFVRNPLYPRSIESRTNFDKRKRKLRYIAWVYHFLLSYVCPLCMVTFLGLGLRSQSTGFLAVMAALGIVRALRQVWQNTFNSLLDLSITCIINSYLVAHTATWWNNAGLSVQLLLVAVCRDRLQQLFQKVVFMLTLAVTSLGLKKQRHKSIPSILILSVFLFPIVLSVILVCAVLSSPLLPLFCLPVFFIGFPRPLRSWPRGGDTIISSDPDAVYYQQLTPKVISSLSQSLATGSLGSRQAGDHFMLRFQDRLVWIHVLECGYRYCCAIVKGLEMQETSCHTVEAARLDEVFEAAFVREDEQSVIYCNPYPWNTLRPCDVAKLDSYSDARNVLTGIIDQPENLKKVSENFLKTLIWVFIQDRKNFNRNNGEKMANRELKSGELHVRGKSTTNTEITVVRMPSRDDNYIDNIMTDSSEAGKTHPVALPRSSSLPSINGSIWSQDSLLLGDDVSPKGLSNVKHDNKAKDVDSLNSFELDELTAFRPAKPQTPEFSFGGFPAADTGKKATKASGELRETNLNTVEVEETRNVRSTKTSTFVATPYHSENSYQLDLPFKWKSELPLTDKQLKPITTRFPLSWYQHVLNISELNGNMDDSIASDSVLMGCYEHLVSTCFALVEVLGNPGASSFSSGPVHPLKVFSGEIPWSLHSDWLQKEGQLMDLVVKAYRYAFKLMYDEAVLGEVTSHEELAEYLTEYENDWYMGKDTDDDWARAVINNKPNLFSLGRNPDDGTYTSRILTKQAILAPVGRLNSEAVRGHWASLALELLYLTNDDEERYSIQAHPVLLRNLTIQAADPPLGYPVYSSGLVSVPVHVSPL